MSAVFAGMPRVSAALDGLALTDRAALRLDVISFFLVVLLLVVVLVRWLWNGLAAEFPRMPRLSFKRAAGLVVLWGAAFVLVLTMISGARELMTPGAWKPDGPTYRLADPTEADRTRKLGELWAGLQAYARANGGAFPPSADAPGVPAELWRIPHASGMPYRYVPGKVAVAIGGSLVAYEPDVFGGPRLALFADGAVRPLAPGDLPESPQ